MIGTRNIHIDFHTGDIIYNIGEHFDAEKVVCVMADAHVNGFNAFAKCHHGNSYYDTRAGHKHPHLKIDMLEGLSQAALKHNIKMNAYYSLGLDTHAGEANPDWLVTGPDGNPVQTREYKPVCMNSPYFEELVLPQTEEIVRGYDINGLWYDITWPSHCFCEYCKKLVKDALDCDIPIDATHPLWWAYWNWRRRRTVHVISEARKLAESIKPGLDVMANGFYISKWPENPAPDSITVISFDPSTTELGTMSMSFDSRCLARSPIPYEVMSTHFHEGWGDWTIKPVPYMQMEAATIVAAGGIPNFGTQMLPWGELDEEAFKRVGEVFERIERIEEYTLGTASVPCVAVCHSATTHFHKTGGAVGGFGDDVADIRGAHKALAEGNFHFDILNETQVNEELDEYPVLVMPNQNILKEETVTAISEFVKKGGVVIAEFETSLKDASGVSKGNFDLADVFGIDYWEHCPYSVGYIENAGGEVFAGIPDRKLLVKGRFLKVTPTTAKTLAEYWYPRTENMPYRFISWRGPTVYRDSTFPAITVNTFGKGKAIYIAAEIFKTFWKTNYPQYRRLVKNLIGAYVTEPKLTVQAPPCVEVSLRKKDDMTIVHLVTSHEEKRVEGIPTCEQTLFAKDVKVSVKMDAKPSSVTLAPEGEEVAFTYENGYVHCALDWIGIHTVIVIQQ